MNELLRPIHDRMLVILPRDLETPWIDYDMQYPNAIDSPNW